MSSTVTTDWLVKQDVQPLTGARKDYDALLDGIGEASHGTHEFYSERAEITKRLIQEKGLKMWGGRPRPQPTPRSAWERCKGPEKPARGPAAAQGGRPTFSGERNGTQESRQRHFLLEFDKEDYMARQKCRDAMTTDVACCVPDDTVVRVAQVMKSENVGAAPIVDHMESKRLLGIVTDRDIVLRIVAEGRDCRTTRIEEAMSRDAVACGPDDSIEAAMEAMERHQVRRIPVIDADRRVVGIISLGDLATRIREPEKIAEVVEEVSKPVEHKRAA